MHVDGQTVRGYIADRDAGLGRDIFDEFAAVVESSEYTICVIDEPFLRSQFSRYKNKVAFKGLLDKQTGPNRRLINLAVGVEISTIAKKCFNLYGDGVIVVHPENYQVDNDWLDQVKNVLFGSEVGKDDVLPQEQSGARGELDSNASSAACDEYNNQVSINDDKDTSNLNLYLSHQSAEICVYKPWRPKGVFFNLKSP